MRLLIIIADTKTFKMVVKEIGDNLPEIKVILQHD